MDAFARLRALWSGAIDQPHRVTEEIARSQRESETWVGAAQIIVIAAAAAAYAFTPRGFSPDAPIAALPSLHWCACPSGAHVSAMRGRLNS